MKKHLIPVISLMLIAPLLSVSSLGAIANEDGTPSAPPAEGEVTIMNTAEETGETDKAKVEERIDKRRTERNFRIPYAEQVKVKERCKAAQGKISSLNGRIKAVEASRTQKYANVVDKLNTVAESLKQHDIDTADLESQIVALQTRIAAFDSELAAYGLVVSDLALTDCQASPVGFRASIEAARESRVKTAEASTAIRSYLQETVKPSLQQLRSQLNVAQSAGQEN